MNLRNVLSGTVLFIALPALLGLPARAADERACTGEIQASLDREERDADKVRAHFVVEVRTEVACARVTYDLIVQELLPNLQWKSVRKTGRLETHKGTAKQKVEHVMGSGLRLLGHEAEIVSCVPCDAE